MLFLALGAGVLLYLIWRGSPPLRAGGWRVGAGLIAAGVLVTGAGLTMRGDWPIGLPVAAVGLILAFSGRFNRGGRAQGRAKAGRAKAPAAEATSLAEARAILGVESGASPREIKAAYMRLMKLNHPDQGGTTGLAAKLNAARERLLKGE